MIGNRASYVVLALATFCVASGSASRAADTCNSGTIKTSGHATRRFAPNVLVLRFSIELESNSFATAKSAGDSLLQELAALGSEVPDGVELSVTYDFGLLEQQRLAWSKGRKLNYQFQLTLTGVPAGGAQELLVSIVDGALERDSKLILEDVAAELSDDATAALGITLLREAVANARSTAIAIADEAELRIARIASVSATQAPPVTGTFGSNLGFIVVKRRFSVHGGVPDVELTRHVQAEFCAEPH
jgi:hypothetical protein